MKFTKKVLVIISVFLMMLLLTACRAGADRFELTNFIGKSLSSFEKKSGLKFVEQSAGVYLVQDVAQIQVPDKEVTSVTLLKNAGEYSTFGVKVGMAKADADKLLYDIFGKEVTKTINSDKNSVTYSYLKDEKELYVSYDIDKETVVELSYYKVQATDKAEVTQAPANNGELIAKIGDTKVYYNEAMVYLKLAEDKYEKDYGSGIWNADILDSGKSFGNMLKDEVINQITELKIIRSEAEKLGISLSEEELAEADSYAKDHYEKMSQSDRNKYLVTEEMLRQVYTDNLLAGKVFETLTINVDTNVSDEEAKQVTVQQILIYSTHFDDKGNKVPLTSDEKEAAYAKVQSLLTQAKGTEDFKTLAEANSEGDTIEYTFGKGQGPKEFGSAFEQAALSLKTGQVSDIITTDYGWHILYCVSDFNEDATIQAKEKIIEQRRNDSFSGLYSDWSKEYDVVVNHEVWDAIALGD